MKQITYIHKHVPPQLKSNKQINKQRSRVSSIYKTKTRQSLRRLLLLLSHINYLRVCFIFCNFAYKYIWLWIEPLAMCPYSLLHLHNHIHLFQHTATVRALNKHNNGNWRKQKKKRGTKRKKSPKSRLLFSQHFLISLDLHFFFCCCRFTLKPMIISLWHLPYCCWLSFNVYICMSFLHALHKQKRQRKMCVQSMCLFCVFFLVVFPMHKSILKRVRFFFNFSLDTITSWHFFFSSQRFVIRWCFCYWAFFLCVLSDIWI